LARQPQAAQQFRQQGQFSQPAAAATQRSQFAQPQGGQQFSQQPQIAPQNQQFGQQGQSFTQGVAGQEEANLPANQAPPTIRRIANKPQAAISNAPAGNAAPPPSAGQQGFASQPQGALQQPAQVQQIQQPAQTQQRVAAQPSAPQSAPRVDQAPPAANDVQFSALQALGGFEDETAPQTQPQPSQQLQAPQSSGQQQFSSGGAQQQAPTLNASASSSTQGTLPIGNWTANVTNGASVKLLLASDGTFRWTATNNGKTSAFDGTYSFENGTLVLVRGSDNQKLNGTLTPIEGGFNFKLAGGKDNGLNFSRS
jgi:hypothetical protein